MQPLACRAHTSHECLLPIRPRLSHNHSPPGLLCSALRLCLHGRHLGGGSRPRGIGSHAPVESGALRCAAASVWCQLQANAAAPTPHSPRSQSVRQAAPSPQTMPGPAHSSHLVGQPPLLEFKFLAITLRYDPRCSFGSSA